MPTPIYYPTSVNRLTKQLNANYTAGATTLTLTNTTSVQNKPGVCVVNRIDTGGALLPAAGVTYFSFTGTSGATLTGVDSAAGSTDQDHAIGEVVEFIADVTWGNAVAEALATVVDASDVSTLKSTIATLTGTQTLTNKTLTAPNIGGTVTGSGTYNTPTIVTPIVKTAYSIGTAGATETVNWANGDRQTMTLDENVTITFSNAAAGQTLTLYMLQDGSGTNTITFADTIVWQDGITWGTSYYTTTADKWNVVVIYYTGSAYLGMVSKFA